jgi:hypothetical protein
LTLRHLFKKLIDKSSFKYEDLANYINQGRTIKTSAQTITNKFNPNSDTHLPNIDECEHALDLMNGWPVLAEFAAGMCGAVVVKLPPVDDWGDMNLLDGFMEATEAQGKCAATFKKSYEDGNIDNRELLEIRAAYYAAIAKQLAVFERIKALVR